jgi:hypothetical protein
MVTNLDDLRRMREKALAKGVGSKAWIDCAVVMIDSFPHLYEMARRMNAELARVHSAILQTLDENSHLADGDNCTLIALKRAIETPSGLISNAPGATGFEDAK